MKKQFPVSRKNSPKEISGSKPGMELINLRYTMYDRLQLCRIRVQTIEMLAAMLEDAPGHEKIQ